MYLVVTAIPIGVTNIDFQYPSFPGIPTGTLSDKTSDEMI